MLLFMTFIKQLHRNKNYVKEEKDEALKHQLIRVFLKQCYVSMKFLKF